MENNMFRMPRTAGLAILSAIYMGACGEASAQTQSGYTFPVTVRSENGKKKNEKPLVFRATVAGKNGRVDVLQGDDRYKVGDYLLTDDGGETFWMASAKRKEATRFAPETLRKEVNKEKFNLTVVSLAPPTATGQRENVAGASAESYQSLRRYTLSGRQLVWSFRVEIEEEWQFAVAAAADRAKTPSFNPVVSFFALTGSAILFKDATHAASGYKTAVPPGMLLRAVAAVTTTEKKKREVETTTIQSDAPVASAIESSRFVIPEGVKRKE